MTALLVYIFLLKEYVLVEVGIEIAFHQRVWNVSRPANKVVDALLRTVCIEYL